MFHATSHRLMAFRLLVGGVEVDEAAHHDVEKATRGLAEVFRRMIGDMEEHMKMEELILFLQFEPHH
ncbi:MAG: hypothetical protein WCD16_08935 [Paracoccaceae bacterium]